MNFSFRLLLKYFLLLPYVPLSIPFVSCFLIGCWISPVLPFPFFFHFLSVLLKLISVFLRLMKEVSFKRSCSFFLFKRISFLCVELYANTYNVCFSENVSLFSKFEKKEIFLHLCYK